MAEYGLKYSRAYLSVKFNSTYFPFDALRFVRALSEENYIPPDSIGPVPIGGRVELKGIVGRKGDVSVNIQTERNVVLVDAPDPIAIPEGMRQIERLVLREFGLDVTSVVAFYEFSASLVTRSERNVLETWSAKFASVPVIERFSKILGKPVSPFGIRIAPSKHDPNRPCWFEIRLDPLLESAADHHSITVVYRNSDRDDVFDFVESFENKLRSLLTELEGE